MARGEMLMVFCYDVGRDGPRRKVASHLEQHATRVQYSVFEARMTEQRANALAQRLAALLDEGDSLRVYAIGKNGARRTRVYGDAVPIQTDEGYWLF